MLLELLDEDEELLNELDEDELEDDELLPCNVISTYGS